MNRFERAMAALAIHEGGYVNHPKDPGGATNKGVTQRTYNAHRRRSGQPKRAIALITTAEVYLIYKGQYWDAVKADDLPQGLAYCVFDAAVNSGPAQSAKWLQSVVGVARDGIIGDQTIAAIGGDIASIINEFCDIRLAFMKRLRHWPTFKGGWTDRVAEVRAQSKQWAAGHDVTPSTLPTQPKASGGVRLAATIKDVVRSPSAMGTAASMIGASGALMSGSGPVQYAIAAALVLGVLTGIWWLVRGRHA
jgi:lysozyme family protein